MAIEEEQTKRLEKLSRAFGANFSHKGNKNVTGGKIGGLDAKLNRRIEVADKYKLDRPLSENMKKDIDAWYKYQVYVGNKGGEFREDGFGYAHFRNSKDMLDFERLHLNTHRSLAKQKPIKFDSTKFEWFIAGATFAGALMCMAYMVWRLL